MNRTLLFLLGIVALSSCGSKYNIEGSSSVSRFDGKVLSIRTIQGDKWIAIDSAEVVHGLFTMKGKIDSVVMATLFMDEESVMPFVIEKGTIKISLDYPNFSAQGTPMNNLLYNFIDKRNQYETQADDLQRKEARMVLEGVSIDDVHAQLNIEADNLQKETSAFIKKFIVDNCDNVLGPNVFIMLCSSLPYPVLTPQIEDILQDVPYSFKNNVLVKDFVSKAKQNMESIRENQRVQQAQKTNSNK